MLEEEKHKTRDRFKAKIKKIKRFGDFFVWKVRWLDKIISEEIQNVKIINGKFRKSMKDDSGISRGEIIWFEEKMRNSEAKIREFWVSAQVNFDLKDGSKSKNKLKNKIFSILMRLIY